MTVDFETLKTVCRYHKDGKCMSGKNFCGSCAIENCPLNVKKNSCAIQYKRLYLQRRTIKTS